MIGHNGKWGARDSDCAEPQLRNGARENHGLKEADVGRGDRGKNLYARATLDRYGVKIPSLQNRKNRASNAESAFPSMAQARPQCRSVKAAWSGPAGG